MIILDGIGLLKVYVGVNGADAGSFQMYNSTLVSSFAEPDCVT